MEMLHDEGDAGPEQQLISQQPRYLLYVVFQYIVNRPASSLFPQKSVWHACESLSGEAATLLHIKFACLKVLSSKQTAFSLYYIDTHILCQ